MTDVLSSDRKQGEIVSATFRERWRVVKSQDDWRIDDLLRTDALPRLCHRPPPHPGPPSPRRGPRHPLRRRRPPPDAPPRGYAAPNARSLANRSAPHLQARPSPRYRLRSPGPSRMPRPRHPPRLRPTATLPAVALPARPRRRPPRNRPPRHRARVPRGAPALRHPAPLMRSRGLAAPAHAHGVPWPVPPQSYRPAVSRRESAPSALPGCLPGRDARG